MTEIQSINKETIIESAMAKLRAKRKGYQVFCVGCGAINRTLHKWHNSYLCSDCWKILKNVGEEQFIKAIKGED